MVKIAKSKLNPIKIAITEKYHLDLEFENELKFVEYILGDADITKGGRDILNAINDKLLDALALFLFEHKPDLLNYRGAKVVVRAGKNGLEFDFENA
jgi:ATP-dependent Clp protease ATP-binding subunit ClpA